MVRIILLFLLIPVFQNLPRNSIDRTPASVFSQARIDALRPIGRAHFILHCTECHTEWNQAFSNDENFSEFVGHMGGLAARQLKLKTMPKAGTRYPLSEKLRADMIEFLEDGRED